MRHYFFFFVIFTEPHPLILHGKDVSKKIIEGMRLSSKCDEGFFISAALTLLDFCGNSRGREIAR